MSTLPKNSTLLMSVPFFSELDREDVEWFLNRVRLVEYPKKSYVFHAGDAAEYMYFIKEGWVKLFTCDKDGDESVNGVMTRGDSFGEESAFEEYDYPYNAQIVGARAECLVLPGAVLRDRLQNKPKIALKMLTALARHRHQMALMYDHFTKLTSAQRLAAFILKLSMDRGYAKTIHLPYNKLIVASRLCMRPETLSRAFKRLEQDIGLFIKGRQITVSDIEALQDYCEIYCLQDVECSLNETLTCNNRQCDMYRFLKLM